MATVDEACSAKRWLPLEANPDVMNQVFLVPSNDSSIIVSDQLEIWKILGHVSEFLYIVGYVQFLWGLGLAPDEAECNDVFGLDDELLEMVPKPVLAVLFLYPITKKVSSF